MHFVRKFLSCLCVCLVPGFIFASDARAQQSATLASATQSTEEPKAPPLWLTMLDALARARKNNVVYQAAVTDAGVAREDNNQARDALLPSVSYNNSAIYSQGIGRPPAVKFIANNAVHEYLSQGNAHEVLDVAAVAELRRAGATAAAARARAEIAARGLVVTVTRSYYAAAAAQQRLDV